MIMIMIMIIAGNDNSLFKFMYILICLLILNNHYRGIPSVICIRYVRFLRQLKEIEGRKTELSDTPQAGLCLLVHTGGRHTLSCSVVATAWWGGHGCDPLQRWKRIAAYNLCFLTLALNFHSCLPKARQPFSEDILARLSKSFCNPV